MSTCFCKCNSADAALESAFEYRPQITDIWCEYTGCSCSVELAAASVTTKIDVITLALEGFACEVYSLVDCEEPF
jgi:hypothetical protein